MSPHSFLAEWCYQSLTERMTITRLDLWHRFQSASDHELAESILHSHTTYDFEDVVAAVSQVRLANAGDLGEFALFALGMGNVPLRPSELTSAQRDILIQLEIIALRASTADPVLNELAAPVRTSSESTLSAVAAKYNVSLEHVCALAKKDRGASNLTKQPTESCLPSLVTQVQHPKSDDNVEWMVQMSRLLTM